MSKKKNSENKDNKRTGANSIALRAGYADQPDKTIEKEAEAPKDNVITAGSSAASDEEGTKAEEKRPRTVAGVSVVDPGTAALEQPVPETRKDKFYRIMDTFGDMFFLNVAFVVTCIPLITIGAAFTALYTMTLRMVRREEGKILPGYFKAFKKNFIPATKAWIVVLLYLWMIYVEYAYMPVVDEGTYKILLLAIGIELLLLSFTLPLLFPVIARYENTTFNYFKNSLILALQRPSVWLRVYITWLGLAVITFINPKILYYAWYVWVFILCSLLAYSSSLIIRKYFDELEEAQSQKTQ